MLHNNQKMEEFINLCLKPKIMQGKWGELCYDASVLEVLQGQYLCLFVVYFSDAVSSSDCIALNVVMISEELFKRT